LWKSNINTLLLSENGPLTEGQDGLNEKNQW